MKILKRDIDAVSDAISQFQTLINSNSESRELRKTLSNLKKLQIKMYKTALQS